MASYDVLASRHSDVDPDIIKEPGSYVQQAKERREREKREAALERGEELVFVADEPQERKRKFAKEGSLRDRWDRWTNKAGGAWENTRTARTCCCCCCGAGSCGAIICVIAIIVSILLFILGWLWAHKWELAVAA